MKTPSRQASHDLANLQAAVNALTVRVAQLEQRSEILDARVRGLDLFVARNNPRGKAQWPNEKRNQP